MFPEIQADIGRRMESSGQWFEQDTTHSAGKRQSFPEAQDEDTAAIKHSVPPRKKKRKKESISGIQTSPPAAAAMTSNEDSASNINTGDSVYGFWVNWASDTGEWYLGTVKACLKGGLYLISFDDEDERELPGCLVVPEDNFEQFYAQAAALQNGHRVHAPRQENASLCFQWHPGVIQSCSSRLFCVQFDDDKKVVKGIKASFVFPRRGETSTEKEKGEYSFTANGF